MGVLLFCSQRVPGSSIPSPSRRIGQGERRSRRSEIDDEMEDKPFGGPRGQEPGARSRFGEGRRKQVGRGVDGGPVRTKLGGDVFIKSLIIIGCIQPQKAQIWERPPRGIASRS